VAQHNEWRTFLPLTTTQLYRELLLQYNIESLPKESRIILVLEALKKDPQLSI